ncbi:hypothetical protein [Tenacibaculum singaporense]|uniref:Uncharacterized protein n=1 Tax=Tenacibaculum singaporense TaxID=2358479 RepID=A0A3Q8RRV9_9FLAO|nr:hypothetical protein [Tenacibaculum singaporense]AZJ35674.1 hypothetical protein D6T69_09135 [Tenacibaculum singaporense]
MKNLLNSTPISILSFLILFLSFSATAQNNSDTVIMMDGKERKGKVTAINDNEITFIYTGETLEYKINRVKVNKIIFASGRTQLISEKSTKQNTQSTSNLAIRKGKMAVLPFKVITNMPSVDKEAVGRQIQTDCSNTIKKDAPMIEVIDPRIVNATLAKNNISVNQLETILPSELAITLGVEHVVFGSYDVENTGTRTSGSTVTSYKSKKNRKGTAISSGSSYTSDTYDSKITMDIYNDKGSNIYSVSRKPFMAGLDKYHSTIKYLVKRAPFGSKHK